MQKMGSSRVAARGQLTLAAAIRDRYQLREGDVLDWILCSVSELCGRPKDELMLVAVPSRPHPIPLRALRELDEASEQADRGAALTLSDLVDDVKSPMKR